MRLAAAEMLVGEHRIDRGERVRSVAWKDPVESATFAPRRSANLGEVADWLYLTPTDAGIG